MKQTTKGPEWDLFCAVTIRAAADYRKAYLKLRKAPNSVSAQKMLLETTDYFLSGDNGLLQYIFRELKKEQKELFEKSVIYEEKAEQLYVFWRKYETLKPDTPEAEDEKRQLLQELQQLKRAVWYLRERAPGFAKSLFPVSSSLRQISWELKNLEVTEASAVTTVYDKEEDL